MHYWTLAKSFAGTLEIVGPSVTFFLTSIYMYIYIPLFCSPFWSCNDNFNSNNRLLLLVYINLLIQAPHTFCSQFFFPGAFISINRYLFKNDGARCSNWEIQLPFYCISDLANTKNFFCVHCVHRKSHLQHTHTHTHIKRAKHENLLISV